MSPPHADTSNRPRLAVSLAGTIRVDDIPTGLVLDDLRALLRTILLAARVGALGGLLRERIPLDDGDDLDVPVLVPPPLRESSVAVLVAPEPEEGSVVKLSGSESERLGREVSVSDTVAALDVTVRVSVSDEEVVMSVVVAPEDTETSVVTELLAVTRVSVAADEVRTAHRE